MDIWRKQDPACNGTHFRVCSRHMVYGTTAMSLHDIRCPSDEGGRRYSMYTVHLLYTHPISRRGGEHVSTVHTSPRIVRQLVRACAVTLVCASPRGLYVA